MSRSREMEENIFLFIPNLIGYARWLFLIVSLYFMRTHYVLAAVFYIISGFLDAFDGWSARKFKQGTSFGAVLDMTTDRCATTCLIMALCLFYPAYMFWFQLVVALDISSHWVQMYSSLIHGETSHKVTDLSANPIMRLYYMRPVLFIFCAANELFFASLYMLYFEHGYMFNVFGLMFGVWQVLAVVTFPISILKQLVSVIQLIVACKNIGALDVVARARTSGQ